MHNRCEIVMKSMQENSRSVDLFTFISRWGLNLPCDIDMHSGWTERNDLTYVVSHHEVFTFYSMITISLIVYRTYELKHSYSWTQCCWFCVINTATDASSVSILKTVCLCNSNSMFMVEFRYLKEDLYILKRHQVCQGLYSLSGLTSYRKIPWIVEAARFGFALFQSLWNLTGTSAAGLTSYLWNVGAIGSL